MMYAINAGAEAMAKEMSQFRSKALDITGFINSKIIRDHTKRKVFARFETERQLLRYLSRNTTLPERVRANAQLRLSQMHCYTNPTQIRSRCIAGGIARGVLRDFRLGRISWLTRFSTSEPQQYQFRMHALAGELPGVRKASW
ncbi:40S ribosomal protein mrp2, mitochondrial [Ascosphaera aggregata]|nr:40S ribosomal protein mrp2, mitochondrial [Ascosphaera aggregata]